MATRWRCPPDSSEGFRFSSGSSLHQFGHVGDAARDVVLRDFRDPQTEREILGDRHARVERIGLEHHPDAAILRVRPGDVPSGDPDLAPGDVHEAGDGVQQRGLPAAGRPEQNDELALGDLERQVVDNADRADLDAEVPEGDGTQGLTLSPHPRRCRGRTSALKRDRPREAPWRSAEWRPC